MDVLAQVTKWPRRPYRGLDYYRDRDAPLFRERDREVRECAQLLLGFGLKILLLHGSSGSGKSSFLHAGLIPALKQARQHSCFFLARDNGVIRASSDPLPAIAGALIAALSESAVFVSEDPPTAAPASADDPLHVAEEIRSRLISALQAALPGDRRLLGAALIQSLAAVCSDLPGRLVLVLDQAEEVLTRSADGLAESNAAAFFRFLEDVYIRNIDLRLVVTLRTEYYGRFRDELGISDDRLAERPAKGGIQQFLLRSLRNADALVRIIEAPPAALRADGTPVYAFTFQNANPKSRDPGEHKVLARRIVDELLAEFPASVTPALQVICASLYQQLPEGHGQITHAAYRKSGGARTMILSYITAGIAATGATRPAEVEKWQKLLHSLVSRQGGGTVVSLAEAPAELVRRARHFGIAGDIRACLAALSKGDAPLLRGEPYDAPLLFSLKHDILADVLARWHDEHAGAAEATARSMVRRRMVLTGSAVVCLFLATIAVVSEHTLAKTAAINVTLKNAYAKQAPTGNYRLSLLVLLANLQATGQLRSWLDVLGSITGIHAETEQALREFLPRAPWFAGEYQAAALDPDGAQLAALRDDTLYLLDLPVDAQVQRDPKPRLLELHPTKPRPPGEFAPRPSVGFITELGPVAYINDTLQFWEGDELVVRGLVLPSRQPHKPFPPRVEFIGGRLQIAWISPDRSAPQHLIRLDAEDLRQTNESLQEKLNEKQVKIEQADEKRHKELSGHADAGTRRMLGPRISPMAVFSEAPGQPQRFGFLRLPSAGPGLELTYEDVRAADDPPRWAAPVHLIDSIERPKVPFPRFDTTLAFAANADAVAYKSDGNKLIVLELSPATRTLEISIDPGAARAPSAPIALSDSEEWRLGQSTFPSAYPPFAIVRTGNQWRAAGLGSRGVWVVENSVEAPERAALMFGGQLTSGEDRGGLKLQFTKDGSYLLLTQQQRFTAPLTVRIWNLRTSWRDWIDALPSAASTQRGDADKATLERLACRIISADGKQEAAFADFQADLFQIDERFRQPCRDR